MTYEEWLNDHLENDLSAGLRVGQSYMNKVRPSEKWPELYYEKCDKKAHAMIWNMEVKDSINLDEWYNL